jgi:hypothetical protein
MLEWLKNIVAPPNASNPTVWERKPVVGEPATATPSTPVPSTEANSALHSDAPINGSVHEPDLLNREQFAKRIAEGIKTVPSANGFVLSLEGPWGFGKTSMLNLMEKNFKTWPENEQPVVCRFNPWMVGNAETLVQSFLLQLAAVIGSKDQAAAGRRAANELLSYSSIFTAFKFVPGAEPWASLVQGTVRAVGTATKDIADLKNLDLERRKDKVVQALKDFGRRIVVFIDDMDRLPPNEVFQMVRLAKSVGDFSGVIYVICFDSGYVASALREFKLDNPEGYLDKVIQTRLSLPVISKDDLLSILNKEYDALPKEATSARFPKQSERVSEIYYLGLRSVLETPRDIKRLFNRLRFTEPGCRGEVNIADLLGLEAVAIKAPAVYEHIKRNTAAYTGRDPGPHVSIKKSEDVVKEAEPGRRAALGNVPLPLQGHIEALLEKLFPLLRNNRFEVNEQSAKTQGLISLPDRLSIALSAGLPSQEVSYASAVQFITSDERREDMIQEVIKADKLSRFIEHVQHAQREHTPVNLHSFSTVLGRALDSAEGAKAELKQIDFFDVRASRRIWWAVETAIEKVDAAGKVPLLEGIVGDPAVLSLATEAITYLQAQYGAFSDERALPEEKRWVNPETLDRLTNVWAGIAERAIRDGSLFSKALSSSTLYRLKKFRPEVFAKVMEEAFPNDENLDRLMLAFGHKGTDTTGGNYALFRSEEFEVLGGAERVKQRAKQRLEDKAIPGTLRHIYEAVLTGKKTYIHSGKESDDLD